MPSVGIVAIKPLVAGYALGPLNSLMKTLGLRTYIAEPERGPRK